MRRVDYAVLLHEPGWCVPHPDLGSPISGFLHKATSKEIIYRLWMVDQRDRLLHKVNSDENTPLITEAIELINDDFDQQLSIENLASDLGMSVSGFHHHFNREYIGLFGLPPRQDINRLRATA